MGFPNEPHERRGFWKPAVTWDPQSTEVNTRERHQMSVKGPSAAEHWHLMLFRFRKETVRRHFSPFSLHTENFNPEYQHKIKDMNPERGECLPRGTSFWPTDSFVRDASPISPRRRGFDGFLIRPIINVNPCNNEVSHVGVILRVCI